MIDLGILNHGGKELTGKYMYHYAEKYSNDLGAAARLPFETWYNRVKNIPYASDDTLFPEEPDRIVELVARPGLLLNPKIFPRLDCKKKSILLGAWAAANNRDFRFLAVSEIPSKEIHHVMAAVDYDGQGLKLIDATFPSYYLGKKYPITFAQELKR